MILSGKYFLKFLIFNIYIVLSSLSCGDANLYLSGTTMGTTYNIKISKNVDSPVYKLQSDIDSILNYINTIYSTYIPNSEINMFNKSTSEDGFVASNDLMYIVLKANDIYSKSNGSFDITVNNIMSLWSLYEPISKYIIPSKSEIDHALSKTGMDMLKFDNSKIIKEHDDISLDANSLVKGYAVDIISDFLEKQTIDNYLVDIGGEIRASGNNNEGSLWSVGIQHPQNDGLLHTVYLNNMSIATSGNYNNYIVIDGKEYSHIINPLTGSPVDNKILSTTVVSKYCVDADAYATALMVMNVVDGLEMINSIENIECMIVTKGSSGDLLFHYSNAFTNELGISF